MLYFAGMGGFGGLGLALGVRSSGGSPRFFVKIDIYFKKNVGIFVLMEEIFFFNYQRGRLTPGH